MAISGLPVRRLEAPAGDVVISGAHGFIGSALARHLTARHRTVRALVRRLARPQSEIEWHPERGYIDSPKLAGADMVVHLSGENIGQRWTPTRRRRIRASRVDSTAVLARALAELPAPPRVLIVSGGVGYYGDRGDEVLDEQSSRGRGFLADVGAEWEAAAEPARAAGIRVINLRMGMVLARDGGALPRLLLPFKLGVGGRLGSGRQWMSWVARRDVLAAISHMLADDDLAGPVNLVSPNPITNAEFTRIVAGVLGRPALCPVPAFALRALFGDMAVETVLASQRARPKQLMERGFEFELPTLEGALRALLTRSAMTGDR